MEKEKGKVFISYSRYSQAHCDLVLAFADLLRKYEIDAVLDRYEECPTEGWPKWMDIQVKKAEFVLIICSESYWHRVNGIEENGRGLGVYFESTITYNHIYFDPQKIKRFIPVLFDKRDIKYVPTPIIGLLLYEMVTQDATIREEFEFLKNLNKKLNEPGFELKKNPGIPDGIADVIKKTIAQKKGQRYRDIKEVLTDLRNIKEIPPK